MQMLEDEVLSVLPHKHLQIDVRYERLVPEVDEYSGNEDTKDDISKVGSLIARSIVEQPERFGRKLCVSKKQTVATTLSKSHGYAENRSPGDNLSKR